MEEARADDKLSQCDEEEDYGADSLVKVEAGLKAMGAVAKLKTELDDRRRATVAEFTSTAQKIITHLEKKLEAAKKRAAEAEASSIKKWDDICLLYTSPSPRDQRGSRMPSSA